MLIQPDNKQPKPPRQCANSLYTLPPTNQSMRQSVLIIIKVACFVLNSSKHSKQYRLSVRTYLGYGFRTMSDELVSCWLTWLTAIWYTHQTETKRKSRGNPCLWCTFKVSPFVMILADNKNTFSGKLDTKIKPIWTWQTDKYLGVILSMMYLKVSPHLLWH